MSEAFGRYQLLRKLAAGGMGQVYLARQKGPVGFEKLVVVKRILPHLSQEPEFIQMFFDEARIAALLNHPHIAQIYDLGDVEGTYYIAMEYVNGESLRSVVTRSEAEGPPMAAALKCRIISDAAGALDFAHRAKSPSGQPLCLIHRDVSPQNLLVGFNGAVKLIDFGVAKAAGKISHTTTGAVKGKYAYMSPEQARGEELDARSDVFGLGIVFHEILTSTRLFKKENEIATLKAVVGQKVPPPSSLNRAVPKGVDAIVLKALSRKRSERFQDAGALQLAIEEFLVKARLPATSAHLAAYLRELYRGEVTEDRTPGEITPVPLKTPSPSRPMEVPGLTPTKKRLSFDEIADERVAAGGVAKTEPSFKPPPGVVRPDPQELQERLKAVGPADRVQGIFFNALLQTVVRRAGPLAEPAVRAAVGGERFEEAAAYPTALFLQLLWRACEAITPAGYGPEQAFTELGAACLERLPGTPAGAALEPQPGADWQAVLGTLLGSLQGLAQPGARTVIGATSRSADLLYKGDPLPPPFHAGYLAKALEKLRGAPAQVSFEPFGPSEVAYRLQW